MKEKRLKGLIAATFTPFNSRGELNVQAVEKYAKYLIRKGLNGVFICGTSGEGLLLSRSERQKVLEAWMPYQGQLDIIAHVATSSYRDSVFLTSHAKELGVDAVACMGPSYLPPSGVEELVAFNEIVANAAKDLPYYYYHIPNVSGVHVRMIDFLKEARHRIPNLQGIKFTSYDMMDMQQCILLDDGRFNILHGHDEMYLSGLSAGVSGGVGTSYNLIPEIYQKIMDNFKSGNIETARKLQLRSIEFVKIMLEYENAVVSTKAMLNLVGLDLGPCRLPLRNLDKERIYQLEVEMRKQKFYQSIVEYVE